MLNELVVAVTQHLLHQSQWARTRLSEHAGKQIRVELPLASVLLRITANGDVEAGDNDAVTDLQVTLPPIAAAKWPIERRGAWRDTRVDGDSELAAAVSYVVANLRWDYEDDLSWLVGDVAGHRIARGVRHLSSWPADAMQSLARGLAEYLAEERRILTTPLRMEEFSEQVDELRNAVERLDKRIDKIAQCLAASSTS